MQWCDSCCGLIVLATDGALCYMGLWRHISCWWGQFSAGFEILQLILKDYNKKHYRCYPLEIYFTQEYALTSCTSKWISLLRHNFGKSPQITFAICPQSCFLFGVTLPKHTTFNQIPCTLSIPSPPIDTLRQVTYFTRSINCMNCRFSFSTKPQEGWGTVIYSRTGSASQILM